nr:hypothetical protein GCM10020063_022490 [Dactylosporangium thailandense]
MEPEILVYTAGHDGTTRHRHGTPGLQHPALQVDDRATVEAAHRAAARSCTNPASIRSTWTGT